MNIFLLIVGCFMETIASITILVPVLLPLMDKIGVDPVHFGLVMVLNLMIGLLTPPVGMVLYILARVANISFERTTRACARFSSPSWSPWRHLHLLAANGPLSAEPLL